MGNHIPPVVQGLKQVRQLEWDPQAGQNASDPMESVRPQNGMKKIESKKDTK